MQKVLQSNILSHTTGSLGAGYKAFESLEKENVFLHSQGIKQDILLGTNTNGLSGRRHIVRNGMAVYRSVTTRWLIETC